MSENPATRSENSTTHGARIRVASYALCLDDADRILLCRIGPGEYETGRWTLPGGGLDFGEAPGPGALRELEEEAGLTGEITDIAGVDSRVYGPRVGRPGELHAIRIIYRVQVIGGSLRDEVDGSTDTCAWFPLDEARTLPLVDLAEHGIRLAEKALDAAKPAGD